MADEIPNPGIQSLVEWLSEEYHKVIQARAEEHDTVVTALGGVIQTLVKAMKMQHSAMKDVITAIQEGKTLSHAQLDILETKFDNLSKLADELSAPIINILSKGKLDEEDGSK